MTGFSITSAILFPSFCNVLIIEEPPRTYIVSTSYARCPVPVVHALLGRTESWVMRAHLSSAFWRRRLKQSRERRYVAYYVEVHVWAYKSVFLIGTKLVIY